MLSLSSQFIYDLRYKSEIMDIFTFMSAYGAGDACPLRGPPEGSRRKDKKVSIPMVPRGTQFRNVRVSS